MDSYWTNILQRRVSRRRGIAATGGAGAAALLLAACGGGSDADNDKSSLLATPKDTSGDAKPGGVWINRLMSAADTMEPVAATGSVGFTHTMPVYSKFTKNGRGVNGQLPTPEMVTGDAMESWETSPDGLQFTFKLRRNHKFDPRPPTNNRAMTTADVKYSVERFEGGSAFRGEVMQKFSPTGMIDSIAFPDDYTVTMKLAFPYGNFQEALAFYPYFVIMPQETERFNPRSEMRGSGPFRLTEFRPDQKLVYAKNTDWYVKDRPFLEGFEQVIIPEYAAALAQFESGAVWTVDGLTQEDVLPVKERHPEMLLTHNLAAIKAPQFQFFQFSMKPDGAFRDARLRQAVSMLIDRGAIVDTFYNVPNFRAAGLPAEGLWHTHDYAGQPNWIDPQKNASELGEGGKFFQFNVAEAKKLISAAGRDGFAFPFEYQTGAVSKQYETIAGMIRDGGLRPEVKVIDSATHRRFQASAGFGFDGMWPQTNGGHNEESWFLNMYHPGGKFTISSQPIPVISDMALAIRKETDKNKRNAMIKDIQKRLAVEMPNFLLPGYAVGFTLSQPWHRNYSVFVSGDLNPNWSSARIYTEYWYDANQQKRS
jgi:ABC-type transport system substrate-binding protein